MTCGALGGADQRWTRTRAGQMRFRTTNMCAAIGPTGLLQLAVCSRGDKTQLFAFADGAIHRLEGQKCLDVAGPTDAQFIAESGLPANGRPVQEAVCNTGRKKPGVARL